MIQLAKKTSRQNKNPSGVVGRAPQRPQSWPWTKSTKVLGEPLLGLAIGSKLLVASRVGCNGLQLCGCQDFAKDVGRAPLGRRLALPGPVGQCARVHSIHLLECPGEVWTAWRALFLAYQEGAGGGFERSAVQALCLCGNAHGVCACWSTPFGNRR